MKKKMWLTLCNLGVSVVFLLSLYSYTKGMRMFSLGLAMALLIESLNFLGSPCRYFIAALSYLISNVIFLLLNHNSIIYFSYA